MAEGNKEIDAGNLHLSMFGAYADMLYGPSCCAGAATDAASKVVKKVKAKVTLGMTLKKGTKGTELLKNEKVVAGLVNGILETLKGADDSLAGLDASKIKILEIIIKFSRRMSVVEDILNVRKLQETGAASVEVTPVPNSINVGFGNTDSSLDLEKFFNQEGGSVSRSRIECDIYDVTVNIDNPHLKLTSGFINDIKKIA